ncbi:MAG: flagellar brake protein [Agarilytica sp.]
MSAEQLEFDDLHISIGQTVEVLPKNAEDKAFSDVILLGAIPGEALIITAPASGVFPKMEEGEKVVMRIKLADGVAIFASNVLFISDVPMYMVYLDFPTDISFKRIRNASRVSVKLPVLVSNVSSPEFCGIAGQITDISTTGAGLTLTEYAGENGDEINMKGKFSVGNIQRVLAIRAVIRVTKKKTDTLTIYGVEFLEDDENDLLVLFGFIFNAMAFGKIQTIR